MIPEHISAGTDAFLKFLTAKEPTIKLMKGNALISFISPVEYHLSLYTALSHSIKTSGTTFYFEQPDNNFALLGINNCIRVNENGPGRFASTEKQCRCWKENFINNWDTVTGVSIPLFMGGMKFTVQHPDEIWQEYSDSTWFVPESLFIKSGSKYYYVFNFIYSRNIDKKHYIEKFKKVYESFSPGKNTIETRQVCINEITGNSPKDRKKWKQIVSDAIENILDKQVEKIVLSRQVKLLLSHEPDYSAMISSLAAGNNSCNIFLMHCGKSVFLGASPEKLISFKNETAEIDALAGSAPRGKNDQEDSEIGLSLLKDPKNLQEHNLVVNFIKQSLKNTAAGITVAETRLKKLPYIQHIWTRISAALSKSLSMFTIINDLFPTPAVCGLPQKSSLDFIKKNELYDRGMYAGLVGWFNYSGDGDFAVAIRSALIRGNRLYAFAGSGIVADSNPDDEFNETLLKLKPILSLFPDENKNK